MGRRKIEIQPITHERNRSVTFLKRKNGLFKKAYELGVLCSVEVAVIIFEERPGHHLKLYQYGSADIHDIVQRHIRHDGEKDTRGPQDFAGNNLTKLGAIGDGDDDDDDDEDTPARSKRRHDGKLKPPSDMVTSSIEYTSPAHRNLSIPQPPPLSLHGISGQSGGGPTLPVSNSRSLDMRDSSSRRGSTRLSLHQGHSRSPSDDPSNGNYYYGQNSSGFSNRSGQYGHGHHSSSQHHNPHHNQNGGQHHSGPQYAPFFPVSSSHQSPPPSFIPLQSDFPRGPSSRGGGGGGGSGFGLPPRTGSTGSSSYENPGMYSSMMRNAPNPASSQSNGSGDPFAGFLDADDQSRHHGQAPLGPSLVGLDWPIHSNGGDGPPSSAPSGHSSSVSAPSATSSQSAGPDGPGNGGNWLDFLSGNPNNPNSNTSNRESTSWERGGGGGGGPAGTDIFGGNERGRAGNTASGGLGSVVMDVSVDCKRPLGSLKGEDDVAMNGAGGILASPDSMNGSVRGADSSKKGKKDRG
ncbi:hypothetical protein GALMADRAFT_91917 [Galerina marginata CBS 339.88]|uniref:MADS-box domain-containing protein n=1 Tax=Galerina marginata (strain CBS 339.88) TaxID=685588 RepID=A0A067TN48_GALM3|nr:hypothetical protein GALMADRAFT_91917 [Galerina marginata CBS 339.88]